MNPLLGSFRALRGDNRWTDNFNLTRRGFQTSFLAIALTIPLYWVCLKAAIKNGADYANVPDILAAALAASMGLMFIVVASILCMVFDKNDTFRRWVTVRNWTQLLVVALLAGILGLFLGGIIPWSLAYPLASLIFLGTLAMDIRLAQTVAEFDIGMAILTGCSISLAGLGLLITGVHAISG